MTLPSSPNRELRYTLALLRTPQVGPRTFKTLTSHFGSPEQLFKATTGDLTGLGLAKQTLEGLRNPDWKLVEEDLRWLAMPGHHGLDWQHPAYPPQLAEIADPPPVLFVRGQLETLSHRQLAIVGSRNPSPLGGRWASEFAGALCECGFAVTSGLALGIDAAAHIGALDAGGLTLAVAGTGLDQVYPSRHRDLAESILRKGGAWVSEFPPHSPPQAANFPRRNRIISGLSMGVLVVEAALRSGSLITARMALEQGREVFAIPGSINNPLARGCNALIKQGAKLVEAVEDILEEFSFDKLPRKPAVQACKTGDEEDGDGLSLLKYIAYAPTSVDTLVAATGKTPEAITSMLLSLELQGHIATTNGGYLRLR